MNQIAIIKEFIESKNARHMVKNHIVIGSGGLKQPLEKILKQGYNYMNNKDISLMDVTVRDGSYLLHYKYTPDQVAALAQELEEAGIQYMEVSHGCGLGAGRIPGLEAAASDEEYVSAAKSAAQNIKIGVIGGGAAITSFSDIDAVIEKVDFIRVAANVDSPESVEEQVKYIRGARSDIEMFFQLMRSSRRPIEKIIEAAKKVEQMGIDALYLVDTTGHFLPDQISEIISRLRNSIRIRIGFHGHNNLAMAVANSLAAVDAGASMLDASLKGIGRAGGNAQMEILVSLLKRKGFADGIKLENLVAAADAIIAPILPRHQGIDSIDVMTADSNIDLYPLHFYKDIAEKSGVEFLDLIRMLGKNPDLTEVSADATYKALSELGIGEERLRELRQQQFASVKTSGVLKGFLRPGGKKRPLVLAPIKYDNPSIDPPQELLDWVRDEHKNMEFTFGNFAQRNISRIEEAEILFSHELTDEILEKAKNLRWYHSVSTIAISKVPQKAVERGIKISMPKGLHAVPIAETALGMMLSLSRKIRDSILLQGKKRFATREIYHASPPSRELMQSTVAIVGVGGVGTALALLCRALGMAVLGITRDETEKSDAVDEQVPFNRFHEAIKIADYVVLATPSTDLTRGMMGAAEFDMMQKHACLINIAHGELVDEDALYDALKRGKIGGAACDVFQREPLSRWSKLYKAPNIIITPHISAWSNMYWPRTMARFALNLDLYQKGETLLGEMDFKKGY